MDKPKPDWGDYTLAIIISTLTLGYILRSSSLTDIAESLAESEYL